MINSYFLNAGYTTLSKSGIKRMTRRGLVTGIWSGLMMYDPMSPFIRVAWKVHRDPWKINFTIVLAAHCVAGLVKNGKRHMGQGTGKADWQEVFSDGTDLPVQAGTREEVGKKCCVSRDLTWNNIHYLLQDLNSQSFQSHLLAGTLHSLKGFSFLELITLLGLVTSIYLGSYRQSLKPPATLLRASTSNRIGVQQIYPQPQSKRGWGWHWLVPRGWFKSWC